MKIFISYSNDDKNKLNSLLKKLSKIVSVEPIVVAEKRSVLSPLSHKVANGIIESDMIISILTEKSIFNQWVNQEIGYAFALNRLVAPIVQNNIMHSLKGFINSNLDLPYSFDSAPENPRKEAILFAQCCDKLLLDIRTQNVVFTKIPFDSSSIKIAPKIDVSFLIGKWHHIWANHPGTVTIDNNFNYNYDGEIDTNKFDKIDFQLSNFDFDQNSNTITFNLHNKRENVFDSKQVLKILDRNTLEGYANENPNNIRKYIRIQ